MIINDGKLIADASVDELRRMTSQTQLAQIFAQLTDTASGIDQKTEDAVQIVMGGADA